MTRSLASLDHATPEAQKSSLANQTGEATTSDLYLLIDPAQEHAVTPSQLARTILSNQNEIARLERRLAVLKAQQPYLRLLRAALKSSA